MHAHLLAAPAQEVQAGSWPDALWKVAPVPVDVPVAAVPVDVPVGVVPVDEVAPVDVASVAAKAQAPTGAQGLV